MFKSIFSKYVVTFMCIILVCFSILSAILVSNTRNNSEQMKRESVENACKVITDKITEDFGNYSTDDFKSYTYFIEDGLLSSMVNAAGEDMFVLITSDNGQVLTFGGKNGGEYIESRLENEELLHRISAEGEYTEFSDLGGFFAKRHLVSGRAVTSTDAGDVGYVLVCTPESGYKVFENKTARVVIIAGVWVMLAALVAVYFISDKIISPIKQMGVAAKEFSQGKFDTRVPVNGQDEVAQLAQAFNNMASALEKNEETRKTFLANVSHDLRTPMTTISGFVEGMLNGAIPPEKQNYYLEIISSEVKRLSRLVSSLLDISRLQAGDRKLNKTRFDICEMARQIIISFEQKLDAKKLCVEFECDEDNMYAFADRDAIYQVLYNICDNAVKFSSEGGKYIVKIIKKEKKLFVSVYNEGKGIRSDELANVFDRFFKSDKSRGLDKTGVGLGLYIVKTIIDSHGEEIWVRSEYDKYCEFVFTLQSCENLTNSKK